MNRMLYMFGHPMYHIPSEQRGLREFGAFKSRRPRKMGKRRRF